MTLSVNPVLGAKALVPYILAKSNVSAARNSANAAGDATAAALATITLPANLLSGSTSIFVHAFWAVTSSANTKTFLAKLGATSIASHSATTTVGNQTAFFLHADNSATAQKGVNSAVGQFGGTGTKLSTTKDCSVAINLTLECNWAGATASETITLESYLIWVFPGQ